MITEEIYNLKQLKEALQKEPKPETLTIKDPAIASALSLLFRQEDTSRAQSAFVSSGCIGALFSVNRDMLIILALLGLSILSILLDKYYIHRDDKDRKWYDSFKEAFKYKKYRHPGLPPNPWILTLNTKQEDKI